MSPDQSSTFEADSQGTPTPVILTFELNREAESDLEFNVWSTTPDAVEVDPSFTLEAGKTTQLISVLPNPNGSSLQQDQTITIIVAGVGLRATAQITIIDVDPVSAAISPSTISVTEAGAQATLTLTLSEPATEGVSFLVNNPTESLILPGSVSINAGVQSTTFTVRAPPDANQFNETVNVSLTQVNGTDQSTPMGATFEVTVIDDDPIDEVITSGNNPNLTFAGADTLWENGIPTDENTITLTVSPAPPQDITFQVGTTDPDALQVLDANNGLPRSLFTIAAGDTSVTILVRAVQDPDKHSELATLYAYTVVGGESPDSTNPSAGAYNNLTATRAMFVVDDDNLSLELNRLNFTASDTLFMAGGAAQDIGDYEVRLVGGAAPAGGMRVLLTTSNPSVADIRDGSGNVITELTIAEGDTTGTFQLVPKASPAEVFVFADGLLPSTVQNHTYRDIDYRVVRNTAGELAFVSLSLAGADSLLFEDDMANNSETFTATISGNLTVGSIQFGIEISNPEAATTDVQNLVFVANGPTSQDFTVTALSDPDYLHEEFQIRVLGGAAGQIVQAVQNMVVVDDDSTLAFVQVADVDLTEGDSVVVTLDLNRAVQDNYGDMVFTLESTNPDRLLPFPSTVVIPEGQSSVDFGVLAVQNLGSGDDVVEILVSGENLGQSVEQVIRFNITDDDVSPVLTFTIDGTTGTNFALTESDPADSSATVTVDLVGGTGPVQFGVEISDPNKLSADTHNVVFQPGSTQESFTIFALQDSDYSDNTVEVRLLGGVDGQVIQGVFTVVITDDEEVITATLSPDGDDLDEGSSVTMTITLSEPVPVGYGDLTFQISSDDPSNVDPNSQSVTIPEGSDTATFDVTAVDNEGYELPQLSTITVTASNNGQQISAAADVNVLDLDVLPDLQLTLVGGDTALAEPGDSVEVQVTAVNLGTAPHAPIALSISSSDDAAVALGSDALSFADSTDTGSFFAYAVNDLDFTDEQVTVTVSGTIHGVQITRSLTFTVQDDDVALEAAFSPSLTTIAEDSTEVYDLVLNQPVPVGGGDLYLTVFTTDPSALVVSGDSFNLVIPEESSSISLRLTAPMDADRVDEEVIIAVSGNTAAGWNLNHLDQITVIDNDTIEFGWELSGPAQPLPGLATETLKVFLTAEPANGQPITFYIFPEDFEALNQVNLDNDEFEIEFTLSSTADTARIGLIPTPQSVFPPFGLDDVFDVIASFGALNNRQTFVTIQLQVDGVWETEFVPLALGAVSRLETPGLSPNGVSWPSGVLELLDSDDPNDSPEINQAVFGFLGESDPTELANPGFSQAADAHLFLTGFSTEIGQYGFEAPEGPPVWQDIRSFPFPINADRDLGTAAQLWLGRDPGTSDLLVYGDVLSNVTLALGAENQRDGSTPTVHNINTGRSETLLVVTALNDQIAAARVIDTDTVILELTAASGSYSGHTILTGGGPAYSPTPQLVNDSIALTIFGDGTTDTLAAISLESLAVGSVTDVAEYEFPGLGSMPVVLHPDTVLFLTDPTGTAVLGTVSGGNIARMTGTGQPTVDTVLVDTEVAVGDYVKGTASAWPVAVNGRRAAFVSGASNLSVVHATNMSVVDVPLGSDAMQNIRPVPVSTTEGGAVVVASMGGDGAPGGDDDQLLLVGTGLGEEAVLASAFVGSLIDGPASQVVSLGGEAPLVVVFTSNEADAQDYITFVQFLPGPATPFIRQFAIPGTIGADPMRMVRPVGSSHVAVGSSGADGEFGTEDDEMYVLPQPVFTADLAVIRDASHALLFNEFFEVTSIQFVLHTTGVLAPSDISLSNLTLSTEAGVFFETTDVSLRFSPVGNHYLGLSDQFIASMDFDSPVIPLDSAVTVTASFNIAQIYGQEEDALNDQDDGPPMQLFANGGDYLVFDFDDFTAAGSSGGIGFFAFTDELSAVGDMLTLTETTEMDSVGVISLAATLPNPRIWHNVQIYTGDVIGDSTYLAGVTFIDSNTGEFATLTNFILTPSEGSLQSNATNNFIFELGGTGTLGLTGSSGYVGEFDTIELTFFFENGGGGGSLTLDGVSNTQP